MNNNLEKFDQYSISFFRKIAVPLARLALFVVYFWFGILKLFSVSPANPLVMDLQQKTLPFLSFGTFIVLFSLYEMLIGVLFVIPKASRIAIVLFFVHMGMTLMPLFLLPQVAWQSLFVPTLEGQYMIKNLVLIALVIFIATSLKPWSEQENMSGSSYRGMA